MGLSGGPNKNSRRNIKQVVIKMDDLVEILKDYGVPEDAKALPAALFLLNISSEEFEDVPYNKPLPRLEIKLEEFKELSLKDLGFV